MWLQYTGSAFELLSGIRPLMDNEPAESHKSAALINTVALNCLNLLISKYLQGCVFQMPQILALSPFF